MAPPIQYLLITVKLLALEKVSFSDTQNPKALSITLRVNDKPYLLNRAKLTEPIQMQLSEKQKTFSQFFLLHF